jgi:hypothetical protein
MMYSAVHHAKDLLAGQGNAIDDDVAEVMLHATLGIHTVCGWRSMGVLQRMDEHIVDSIVQSTECDRILAKAATRLAEVRAFASSGRHEAVELLDKIHTAAYPPGTGAQHVKGLVATQNLAGQDNFTAR